MAKNTTKKTRGAQNKSPGKNKQTSREDIVMNQNNDPTRKEPEESQAKQTAAKGTSMNDEFTDSIDRQFDDLEQQVSETAREVADSLGQAAGNATGKNAKVSESELEKLKRELDEAKDRGLRALAELENYRSRTNRAMAEDRKYAAVDLARAILPVWDNMGRAIEAAEKDFHPEAMLDGLKMMYQQFLDVFRSQHIEKIEAMHEQFNPYLHESIASFPNADYQPNTVIHESQAGFILHDRVIRPAQVVLAAPAPAAPSGEPKEETEA